MIRSYTICHNITGPIVVSVYDEHWTNITTRCALLFICDEQVRVVVPDDIGPNDPIHIYVTNGEEKYRTSL
jgi:hypothetical protein